MHFNIASTFMLHFGPYSGRNVGSIGATEEGLLWLQFVRRDWEAREMPPTHELDAICSYLDHPSIAARVLCLPKAALS